jgi:hypothetical protein
MPLATPETTITLDTFICVHDRDLGPLFEVVLRSYQRHFKPKGQLLLICNDVAKLRDFLARTGLGQGATVSADEEWLSPQEQTLPGWYRQQIIKLRAHKFCDSADFCSLGADTVLLQPIEATDFVDGDRAVLYYHKATKAGEYLRNLHHLRYERDRVKHVARLLHVTPRRARRYGDFISDLFCFRREYLVALNDYLEQRYGAEPYYELLRELGNGQPDTNPFGGWTQNRFGEWTLYSVYVLDCLRADVAVRNGVPQFMQQVHSQRQLRHSRFDAKVIHLVAKDLDLGAVRTRIAARDAELAAPLQEPLVNLFSASVR